MTHQRFLASRGSDQGTAILLALVVSAAVCAIGIAFTTVCVLEREATSHFVAAEEALFAAESLVEHGLSELADVVDWDDVLNGSRQSAMVDTGHVRVAGRFDVVRATADLQAATDSFWNLGLGTPRWQIYASGAFADLLGDGLATPSVYLAAWVADDPDDDDSNPLSDHNGRLLVRVRACGASGACRALRMTIARGDQYSSESPPALPGPGPGGQSDPGPPAAVAQFLPHLSAGGVRGASGVVRVLSWREEQ